MKFHHGDKVTVIRGFNKGRTGEVRSFYPGLLGSFFGEYLVYFGYIDLIWVASRNLEKSEK